MNKIYLISTGVSLIRNNQTSRIRHHYYSCHIQHYNALNGSHFSRNYRILNSVLVATFLFSHFKRPFDCRAVSKCESLSKYTVLFYKITSTYRIILYCYSLLNLLYSIVLWRYQSTRMVSVKPNLGKPVYVIPGSCSLYTECLIVLN